MSQDGRFFCSMEARLVRVARARSISLILMRNSEAPESLVLVTPRTSRFAPAYVPLGTALQ